ncbi:hypothetical protein FH972_014598 [Carpinus fangiana]|uniref:Dirigent protein n=1 Tax=Carpinus fangiana TaxID=176857 RepID=A0A5N6RDG2_9ROSI|nr:hypothetical protein FH972_014598 [Carpinus fangiana]
MDPGSAEAPDKGKSVERRTLLQGDSLLHDRYSLVEHPENALLIATMRGQTESVRELLKLKPNLATRLDKDGFSALHIASEKGFVEIVRELLTFSRELARLKSRDGRTCLHRAAATGRVQVVRELVGFFRDCIGEVTPRGETALHIAVKYDQFEVFEAMFHMLKQLNRQDILKDILNAGDEDGNTVLHLAIARKQSRVVRLLLPDDSQQEAVCVSLTNKNGFTALDVLDVIQQMAGEPIDYKLRDLLLRAGALRASELENVDIVQETKASTSLWQFLLHEISLLNPLRFWKTLANEVKSSPLQTQNALLVVAVLIATITYQAILNPPGGLFDGTVQNNNTATAKPSEDQYFGAYIATDFGNFIPFMVVNTIGFFVSLVVIILVMDEFPLKALLGIAVRCMAAGVAGNARTFTQFGTVFVTDDFITESADPNSPAEVGCAQGMYVTAGLDGLNLHVMISTVFTNKEYSGSTLEIQGVS